LRHDKEAAAARFGVSFDKACHRLSTMQRPDARGVPLFFLRVDPAGKCVETFLCRGFFVRALWRLMPKMGRACRLRATGRSAGAIG
jgi:predicted transcriptional regulator